MIESVTPVFKKKFSGFNTRNLLVFMIIASVLPAQAQEYARKISWSTAPKTMHVVGDKKITQPTFKGAAHLQKYGTGIDNASVKYITSTLQPQGQLNYYRKQAHAVVTVLPFRKNPSTGALEKLESFTVKLTLTPGGHQLKSLNTYAANSVLANGTWYQLTVNADGIYKIDYNFLKKTIGVNPSSINVSKLAVFGNGGGMVPDENSVARPDDLQENPTLFVDQNNNGQFDQGDYLLFYGQNPDNWQLNAATKQFYHTKNLYTNFTYYFLTTDAGTGKRVQTETATGSPNKTFNYFDDHQYRNNDQTNLLQSGKTWMGDQLTSFNNTESFTYSFPNLILSDTVTINSTIAVNSTYPSTSVTTVNGLQLISQYDSGIPPGEYPQGANQYISSAGFMANATNLNIGYTFNVT
jgi:hypothetical protein